MATSGSLRYWHKRVTDSVYARQVGTTMAGRVLQLFIALGTTAMTARWLGPGGKGQLAILLLAPYLLQLALNLGIGDANVYFTGSQRLSVAQLSANSVAFALLSSAAGAVIVLLLLSSGELSVLLPGIPLNCLLLSLLSFPVNLLSLYLQAILRGLRLIFVWNVLNLVQAALVLALMPVFVAWLELGVAGALLAYLLPQAVVLLLTALTLRSEGARFRPRWNPGVVRPTLHFGVKGFIANLLDFFNYRLDSFLVNFFVGPSGAGIYSASVALAELLWQFPISAAAIMFPKAAASSHETMNRFTPRVFWITLAVSALGAAGLVAVGKLAILIIYSRTFLDAYTPLLALLPGVVLVGSARILNNDVGGRGFPHYNSITAGLALVVTVVLDLLLIPRMGVLGAAVASSVSYAVMFALSVGFYLAVSRGRSRPPEVIVAIPRAFDA
ncbi:MAG: oligosaccharide flippase family protein [Elusimicrobia bacterium]|nr:oligosaccharide flippase family protein [Elusimicrobiota bacterium]